MSHATSSGTSLLDRLLTPADLAARLGVSERTLARWRETGSGPTFIRTGGRSPRYSPDDVDEWLLNQRRTSTAEER
ncbi:MAG: helix-turn-helix domain-containing protein [Propionibacteriaceae bacterium]|nr:helix-turn-helix domain-containing protein [Propionibacteriaceae bacterium]